MALAEPIEELISLIERTAGLCNARTIRVKDLAAEVLGCGRRLLHSVRSAGRLIPLCPQLAQLKLHGGISRFWEGVLEKFSKAVTQQANPAMKAHALGRMKLELARLSSDQTRQQLIEWFEQFSFANREEQVLWMEHMSLPDVFAAGLKLANLDQASQQASPASPTAPLSSDDEGQECNSDSN